MVSERASEDLVPQSKGRLETGQRRQVPIELLSCHQILRDKTVRTNENSLQGLQGKPRRGWVAGLPGLYMSSSAMNSLLNIARSGRHRHSPGLWISNISNSDPDWREKRGADDAKLGVMRRNDIMQRTVTRPWHALRLLTT